MTRSEAIKVLEKQFDKSCGNYHYQNADKLDFEDALWVAISALRQQDARKNDPLTLDELRQMDGEPVWIKLFDPDEEFWVLRNEWVDTRNPEPMILFHMRWYSHVDYGKTWLAYRRKPEEDDHE